MSDERREQVSKRGTLVWELLALLGIAVVAWVFWPYPDRDRVLRSLVDELGTEPAVVMSVDSSRYVTYREGMTNQLAGEEHISYSEPSRDGTVWHVSVPVLSTAEVDGGTVLLEGIVSERAGLLTRSWASAKLRVTRLGNLLRNPSEAAMQELFFGPPQRMRLCMFSPDFEIRDADNPENRLMVSLGCSEVQGWIGGESDWGVIDAAVKERYLAFAAAEGMRVTEKHAVGMGVVAAED